MCDGWKRHREIDVGFGLSVNDEPGQWKVEPMTDVIGSC